LRATQVIGDIPATRFGVKEVLGVQRQHSLRAMTRRPIGKGLREIPYAKRKD